MFSQQYISEGITLDFIALVSDLYLLLEQWVVLDQYFVFAKTVQGCREDRNGIETSQLISFEYFSVVALFTFMNSAINTFDTPSALHAPLPTSSML